MRSMILIALLFTQADLVYAQGTPPLFRLTELKRSSAYVYVGGERYADDSSYEHSTPIEISYVNNSKDEFNCYSEDPIKSFASWEVFSRYDGYREQRLAGIKEEAWSEEAMVGLRFSACLDDRSYLSIEGGYRFDLGEESFDSARYGGANNFKYVGFRLFNPSFYPPFEAAVFYSHFDDQGDSRSSVAVLAGFRSEYLPGHEVALSTTLVATRGAPVAGSVSVGVRSRVLGSYVSADYKKGVTSASNGNLFQVGLMVPF